MPGAIVYAYPTPSMGLKQEYLAMSGPSDGQGLFTLELENGQYYLIARKRQNGSLTGPVMIGDYRAEYRGNPVEAASEKITLDTISMDLITTERNSNLKADAGYLEGQVLGENRKRAYVYVYPKNVVDKRGPGYEVALRLSDDGRFKVALNPGSYTLVIRSKASGQVRGPLGKGDYVGRMKEDAILVEAGKTVRVEPIILKRPDPKTWEKVQSGVEAKKSETIIRGRIVDYDKRPVAGIYAFLYAEEQVVGKPLVKSAASRKDGSYVIYPRQGGTYYLGARSSLGGPLTPGDLVGTYSGKDGLITLKSGQVIEDAVITVERFTE